VTERPEVTDSVLLRTGERVSIRPIRTSDAPGLAAMHARLTADSIYRRYFAARPGLSPKDARWLTTLDEAWRFALVPQLRRAPSSEWPGANIGMLKLLRSLDLPMRAERDGSVVTFLLNLRGMAIPRARLDIATAHIARAASARRSKASA